MAKTLLTCLKPPEQPPTTTQPKHCRPQRPADFRYAAKMGVEYTTFDCTSELVKIAAGAARLLQRPCLPATHGFAPRPQPEASRRVFQASRRPPPHLGTQVTRLLNVSFASAAMTRPPKSTWASSTAPTQRTCRPCWPWRATWGSRWAAAPPRVPPHLLPARRRMGFFVWRCAAAGRASAGVHVPSAPDPCCAGCCRRSWA